MRQHAICGFLGKAPERRPFAADQGIDGDLASRHAVLGDGMVAADSPRILRIASGQRTDAAVNIFDLVGGKRNARKHFAHDGQHVVALRILADGEIGIGDRHIG